MRKWSTNSLHRTTHRTLQGRGQRLRQPQIKEERKTAVPRDVVAMMDGTFCAMKGFHDLRSNAHKKLKDDFSGIAMRIRLAVAEHEGAWDTIMDWINTHRPKYGHVGHQNDTLIALALVYTANRFKRPVSDIVRDIMRTGSAKVLLPPTQ